MKELLKLLPILGLVSLLNLTIGCAENTDMGDDTPPSADEEYNPEDGEPPNGEGGSAE